ncbi:MAG: hypothetical protein ACOYMQ_12110 [Pseudanabaena sp.]
MIAQKKSEIWGVMFIKGDRLLASRTVSKIWRSLRSQQKSRD